MKRFRWVLLVAMLAVLARVGWTCAFPDDREVFIQQSDPDHPYARYAGGRLGLLSGGYRVRHLVVAFRTLTGQGLTPAEQKAAEGVDRFYNPDSYYNANNPAPQEDLTGPGLKAWVAAAPGTPAGAVERKVPGDDYETFTNCLDDAFRTAAVTLADRKKRYGDTPAVADWVNGQQAVFSNCAGPGQMPQAAGAGAPVWLKQDRAYQVAAAQFYATQYDAAIAGFRAVAADRASPWAKTARYVVARAMIRRATVLYISDTGASEDHAKVARARLAEARAELQGIVKDPAMASIAGPARQLLDYVQIRLDPAAQAAELARRLSKPQGAAEYRQNLIDLTFAYHSLPFYTEVTQNARVQAPAGMLRWMNNVSAGGLTGGNDHGLDQIYGPHATDAARAADALAAWRQTHATEWLVAAMMTAMPAGNGTADLIAAARAVPAASPAFATVTYERLRLQAGKGVYDELKTLMPGIESAQPISTINAFADLRSDTSPTLASWLDVATRLPASYGDTDGGEGSPLPTADKAHAVTLCGVNLYAATTRHLDDDTALILNQRMPLKLLREAALSPALPGNVRFQLAHMAWTRALLLEDADTANALGPYLAGCQPAMKPYTDAYAAAKTADERHVAGLLAMMRFTSTELTVYAGIERDFASYSEFRGNWWCAATPSEKGVKNFFLQPIVARSKQADPSFLGAADRTAAEQENARLSQVPGASDYFAQQALRWVKEHPTDAHNAEVLGFASRVVRNGCRSDATAALNHQLFDALHSRYPQSEWAKKYTTWE